jgi:hypothetical protein
MFYRIAADWTVILHLFWILFLIFGAWPGSRFAWVRWTHIGGLAFSLLMQVFSWDCPLTDLELWLRSKGEGTPDYAGSFIAHYAEKWVYMEIPPGWLLTGTACVAVMSLWVYRRGQVTTERQS